MAIAGGWMNRGTNLGRRSGVRHCCGFLMTVALALTMLCTPSLAQDAKPGTKPAAKIDPVAGDKWVFTVAPYAWAVGIVGDVGVGDRKAHVNASFLDILKDSDSLIGLQGHIEAQHGRWGLFFDGTYADLGADYKDQRRAASLKVDMETKLSFIEVGGFYRIIDNYQAWKPSEDYGGGRFSADLLTGARYTYLGFEADGKLDTERRNFKRDFDGHKDWVDPFIGARAQVALTDRIDFSLRGDIGGFSVGSKLAWNTQALFGFHYTVFGVAAESWAGYRAMGQNYEDNSGRNFSWDVIVHGPVIGTAFTW
jgi:hypothetical protein